MQNLDDLKQQARALEQKGEHQGALELYTRISGEGKADASTWRKIGDLNSRLTNPAGAVGAYEHAIDAYLEEDLPNIALKLGAKVLRLSSDAVEIKRRLGDLALAQGYLVDASEHLLSYARDTRAADRSSSDRVVAQLLEIWAELRGRGLEEQAGSLRAGIVEIAPDAEFPRADTGPTIDEEATGDLELQSFAEGLSDDTDAADLEPLPDLEGSVMPTSQEDDLDTAGLSDIEPLEGLEGAEAAVGGGEDDTEDFLSGDLPLLGADADFADSDAEEEAGEEEHEALPLLPLEPEAPPQARAPEDAPPTAAQKDEVEQEPAEQAGDAGGDYVDLGALIMDDTPEAVTRFIMEAAEPSGDEDKDFADMLKAFKSKVADHIDAEDATSHYDLGLAYKEMGLLDEAISQLQVALRAGSDPLATLEMLGECFVQKRQYTLALRVLERAAQLRTAPEADLVGVYYWAGRCEEELEHPGQAREYYERIVAIDLEFRDAAKRLSGLR